MISPDRLAALIAGWAHEAEVAEANQRADEYANTCRDTVEALCKLDDKVARLKSQLPLGMAHCTIVFNECALGHGWLSATNWVQHECPTCSLNAARKRAEAAEKALRTLRAAASELLLSMRQVYERGDKAILDRIEDALPK